MKRILIAVVSLVVALGATACGESNDGGPPSKVIIAAGGSQAVAPWAAHLAARGQHFFEDVEKKFNVDIEFLDMDTGSTIPSLTSGTVDFLIAGVPAFATARSQGMEVVAITEVASGQNMALVGSAKHKEDFGTDLRAFADSAWGYTAPGSTSAIIASEAATAAGLDFANLNTVAFGKLSAAIPGLESNRLDIVSVDVGTAGVAISDGAGYLIYNANTDMKERTIGTALMSTSAFIEKNPELTQSIVDVYLRGMGLVQRNIDDASAVLASFPADYQKLMSKGFDQAWKLTAPGLGGDGRFTDSAIESTVGYLSGKDYFDISAGDEVKAGFDNRFVQASQVQK
ncbi:ABC transporter substrate-binding protein [Rhodococcus globerulus]|uniref:ABC transporter substrate-binding protein n=1 Tax=Rhodococcus globerulus TaxID=33008 RepID=A0ABU4C4I7_RHOGO|nr:ABC transporter substrate-binding protein [Rhodococcus globerulus]MDV6271420.1 ABC transporter substrate-binding protein [Rhodococcus globerulus]